MKQSIGMALSCALLVAACGGGEDNKPIDVDAMISIDAPPDMTPDANLFNPCKKVDILFSVDASGTMREEIMALSSDVFPAFAERLRNVGRGVEDYRVGVIDACPAPATLHTRSKTVEDCEFESGERWIDSSSSKLNAEFSCVADIYSGDYGPTIPGTCTRDNDDEQPAHAAATALLPPFIDNENAGFLRDDALLVIVAMTDEDETAIAPGGDPIQDRLPTEQIYEKLVSIKGSVHNMVFLGIGGLTACTADQGQYGAAKEARRLKALTDMFIANERGVFWDLCTGRLEDGLESAMLVIEATCNVVN